MKQKQIFFYLLFLFSFIHSTQQIILTKRQQCDLELILNGAFTPLSGFLTKSDYDSVVKTMRLSDGSVWPIPITLDVDQKIADSIIVGTSLELRTSENVLMATMTVCEKWMPDKQVEAQEVFGTTDQLHPGVAYLLKNTKEWYLGGPVTAVSIPHEYDFSELRKTPAELKTYFKEKGISTVIAFQTRNPMHRAHVELTKRAGKENNAHVLIHPVVGMTKPGDIDYITRVRCYKKLLNHYENGSVSLSLLPLAMRMAGPREALWHALIRKNYGCTHFIVGRDHAGPGNDASGKPFYGPYDAQELVSQYEKEIGITMVPFKEMVYVVEHDAYFPADEVPQNGTVLSISGTQQRALLSAGKEIPEWFTYPEIVEELRLQYPARSKQGFTVFLTGLSGAGKSTIVKLLQAKLMEIQDRKITILDGDVIRTNLSRELGFSKEHRSINVQRVGFVAQEITKHGGIALCALIAPYEDDRLYNKNLINSVGCYIEVYLSTPLSVCEERDVKGLYQKAREGKLTGFTGIDDPYEIPKNPTLILDTSKMNAEEAAESIIQYLKNEGYIQ